MEVPYLNEKQLAERWGMSHKTLQRWRVEKRGPRYLKIGGAVRYPLSEIEAFESLALRGNKPQRPTPATDVSEGAAPRFMSVREAIESWTSIKA